MIDYGALEQGQNGKQPVGQKQSDHTPEHRQQHVLSNKLPNDPPASRTEGAPKRELPFPRDPARQLQIRDVRAANQQEESNPSH